jgi:hypothetical protein
MKKNITFGLICLVSLLVLADTKKEKADVVPIEMYCFTSDQVGKALQKFGEVPVAIGLAYDLADSTMSLWSNPGTGSWTLVATKDNTSCILGTGNSLKLLKYGKQV